MSWALDLDGAQLSSMSELALSAIISSVASRRREAMAVSIFDVGRVRTIGRLPVRRNGSTGTEPLIEARRTRNRASLRRPRPWQGACHFPSLRDRQGGSGLQPHRASATERPVSRARRLELVRTTGWASHASVGSVDDLVMDHDPRRT